MVLLPTYCNATDCQQHTPRYLRGIYRKVSKKGSYFLNRELSLCLFSEFLLWLTLIIVNGRESRVLSVCVDDAG